MRVLTLMKHMIYQERYIIIQAITIKEMYRTLHGQTHKVKAHNTSAEQESMVRWDRQGVGGGVLMKASWRK